MENNNTFKMTYSAQEQAEIDNIRKKYTPREQSKLEQLRALDASATKKAAAAALIVGIVGALILGLGMSLVMTQLGEQLGENALPVGTIVGLAGLAVAACAYPLYQRALRRQRKKIAPLVLQLTDELTK